LKNLITKALLETRGAFLINKSLKQKIEMKNKLQTLVLGIILINGLLVEELNREGSAQSE
jgi:hypothetical protein